MQKIEAQEESTSDAGSANSQTSQEQYSDMIEDDLNVTLTPCTRKI